jgi:hypothetical protein
MNSSSSIYVSHKLIKDIKDGLPSIVNNDEKIVENVMEYIKIKLRYDENSGSYNKLNYEKYKKNYYEKNKEEINKKNAERMRIRRLKIKENKLEIEKI